MSEILYAYNLDAYQAAVKMLRETGKAAVIHPTGTGKSFIGLKLCADHPKSTVCWLSPSEHIFHTQLENWERAGGAALTNIRFYTYSKLILMSDEQMREIRPDFIVLDEFHRCGAQIWGQSVRKLFDLYPDVPVLGLSATNIRYLDNQRDMADELFDGNVASEMSLGEAIVRGILNPPKYVLSIFAYRKDLEKYEKRVRKARSKAVRSEAERYLEALRRALEKADGLDRIFDRHMENRTGKYIVFCASHEHMEEMISLAGEWFGRVDPNPHIYSAYSDDPETSEAFAAFKKDDSDHLKLLYCIDMLNEGIHVEDVSGVILLRPTVSPIIYKQQIGRALSTGRKGHSVIFDIVLNIENLYSIGAIEDEMEIAAAYYRDHGETEEVVNEHFRVIDEVRDCRRLFEKLNDSLTASWNLMYQTAKRYFEENGDLEVPKRYVTEEGYALGSWLNTQRLVYAGKVSGNLSESQIEKLNAIGMRWEAHLDSLWERNYAAAREYAKEHGNLLVPAAEETADGFKLGRWIAQLRVCRKNHIRSAYVTPEHIADLDAIGMIWDVSEYLWEQNYQASERYVRENGSLDPPSDYVDDQGVRLGAWICALRNARGNARSSLKITEDQIRRLDQLGMNWAGRQSSSWNRAYEAACRYKKEHGNLDIPVAYVSEEGIRLGRWIRNQRANDRLSSERREKLSAIGMVWKIPDAWDEKFALVKKYCEEHGNLQIPANYVSDGVWIARWLSEQIARYNGKPTGRPKAVHPLTAEQKRKLESLGIRPNVSRSDIVWMEHYREAENYFRLHGNLKVPSDYIASSGKNLNLWLQRQRRAYRSGTLKEEQRKMLDQIGMCSA